MFTYTRATPIVPEYTVGETTASPPAPAAHFSERDPLRTVVVLKVGAPLNVLKCAVELNCPHSKPQQKIGVILLSLIYYTSM
jgi:hypothetical protein